MVSRCCGLISRNDQDCTCNAIGDSSSFIKAMCRAMRDENSMLELLHRGLVLHKKDDVHRETLENTEDEQTGLFQRVSLSSWGYHQ